MQKSELRSDEPAESRLAAKIGRPPNGVRNKSPWAEKNLNGCNTGEWPRWNLLYRP